MGAAAYVLCAAARAAALLFAVDQASAAHFMERDHTAQTAGGVEYRQATDVLIFHQLERDVGIGRDVDRDGTGGDVLAQARSGRRVLEVADAEHTQEALAFASDEQVTDALGRQPASSVAHRGFGSDGDEVISRHERADRSHPFPRGLAIHSRGFCHR